MTHGNHKHGAATKRTREYEAWRSMRQRCTNSKSPNFSNYGERGITICKEWENFETFLSDMGYCPIGMSLDRIDNNSGYAPGNCRWTTRKEQTINRRGTIFVSINDARLCLKDACKALGLNYGSVYSEIRHKGVHAQVALENARAAERIR